jgi:hypothetical protein
MSSPIDNNEFMRIGRKHDNNKSRSSEASRESKKREKQLPSAGHGQRIDSAHSLKTEPSTKLPERKNRKTYFKDDDDIMKEYREIAQGEEDAYAEIDANGRAEFFEEHFRLLKELSEEEYHDYLDNIYAVDTHAEDMSGCEWIVVNENIKKYETRRTYIDEEFAKGIKRFNLSDAELEAYKEHIGNLDSLKKYYEEADAHVDPEYLETLKADIEKFNDLTFVHDLEDDVQCCSEEWMEMVDSVNREQGYY